MNLLEVVNRIPQPAPWSEGDNIPWNDPEFSQRMLHEHLDQSHSAASRPFHEIDRHVAWIHRSVLAGRPARILDLGCGPGLYAQRLAALGHSVVGVDYSPASLEYARRTAQQAGLDCTYLSGDLRQADYGQGYQLAIQIYGELNVFSPVDAVVILTKTWAALAPGGQLLMEVHDYPTIRRIVAAGPNWSTAQAGLFGDQPYLYLREPFWDEASQTCTVRMLVVDAASARVTRYAETYQAYRDDGYRALFKRCDFGSLRFIPDFSTDLSVPRGDFFLILAQKIG